MAEYLRTTDGKRLRRIYPSKTRTSPALEAFLAEDRAARRAEAEAAAAAAAAPSIQQVPITHGPLRLSPRFQQVP